MSKRIAVVLSGCGFMDGAEIHESVLTLLHLHEQNLTPHCFAPDKNQTKVVNHKTEQEENTPRNILTESARIARGQISPLSELKASDFDALVFPGGFGAALNLCDFAIKGPDCAVDADAERVIQEFYQAKKPIGAICIAPALIARVLGSQGVSLTIGHDEGTAQAIESLGAKHQNKKVDEIAVDDAHKIVSTPAYMLGQNPAEVGKGIKALIQKIAAWV